MFRPNWVRITQVILIILNYVILNIHQHLIKNNVQTNNLQKNINLQTNS